MDADLLRIAKQLVLPVHERALVAKLPDVASASRFEGLSVHRESRFATAFRHTSGGSAAMGTWTKELTLLLEWRPSGEAVELMIVVYDARSGLEKVPDIPSRNQVVDALRRLVRNEPLSLEELTVLAPGESLSGPPRGPIRDYSRCAREDELCELYAGDLPLGRYAFARTPPSVKHGKRLYLSKFPRTGQPMIYNGVLLCAPQNSGKTELLLKWAAAANSARYSMLIIDVKGNVRNKLNRNQRPWLGDLFCFSTRPGTDSDRINFLAPLAHDQPLDSRRLEALAGALLPAEGWDGEGGEAEMFYQGRLLRLTALIHILKFRHQYFSKWVAIRKPDAKPFDTYHRVQVPVDGTPTLAELYDLATDEDLLCFWIKEIRRAEEYHRGQGRAASLPEKTVDGWARDIATMLHPESLPGIGQRRDPKTSYREFTYGVALALQPFSEGLLKQRTAPTGAGRLFDFSLLNRHASDNPVTLLLEVGEDDAKQAAAVVSLTIRALEPVLHARMHSLPREGCTIDDWQPLLLLLDETRRIRGFNPVDYITFARERRAGCVLVYQALNLIGSPADIDTVLANVGTQIYLGKLVGNTAEAFCRLIPAEDRKTFVTNELDGSVQSRWEPRPLLTAAELYHLPAGRWPALVHIHDLPCRKPFLVDLDHEFQ